MLLSAKAPPLLPALLPEARLRSSRFPKLVDSGARGRPYRGAWARPWRPAAHGHGGAQTRSWRCVAPTLGDLVRPLVSSFPVEVEPPPDLIVFNSTRFLSRAFSLVHLVQDKEKMPTSSVCG